MRKADLKEVYTQKKINHKDIGAMIQSFSYNSQKDIDINDGAIVSCFLGQENHLYLLQTFADSVSAFINCFKLLGVSRKSTDYVIYEFARRVEKNGSAGTDYGTTALLFVIN